MRIATTMLLVASILILIANVLIFRETCQASQAIVQKFRQSYPASADLFWITDNVCPWMVPKVISYGSSRSAGIRLWLDAGRIKRTSTAPD
jgi:hypothetical protein